MDKDIEEADIVQFVGSAPLPEVEAGDLGVVCKVHPSDGALPVSGAPREAVTYECRFPRGRVTLEAGSLRLANEAEPDPGQAPPTAWGKLLRGQPPGGGAALGSGEDLAEKQLRRLDYDVRAEARALRAARQERWDREAAVRARAKAALMKAFGSKNEEAKYRMVKRWREQVR